MPGYDKGKWGRLRLKNRNDPLCVKANVTLSLGASRRSKILGLNDFYLAANEHRQGPRLQQKHNGNVLSDQKAVQTFRIGANGRNRRQRDQFNYDLTDEITNKV